MVAVGSKHATNLRAMAKAGAQQVLQGVVKRKDGGPKELAARATMLLKAMAKALEEGPAPAGAL
jgi:hypothetical protein